MSQLRELLDEAWLMQAYRAFQRFLDENPNLDPIIAERTREPFLQGFVAASRPPMSMDGATVVVPLDVPGVIELGRVMAAHITAFAKHGSIAPGDMMTALAIVQAMIGRQMHPSLSNSRVYDIFSQEAMVVLAAMDKLQSSEGEVKH